MTDAISRLRANIARVLLGNTGAIEHLIVCLLARGHLLIEDVPGVGKTVLATALARSVDCSFSRLQLTPDLLPSDILGVSIYDKATGQFTLQRGPIFANVVLADEINRTPPRTQAALLEAMSEATVSIDGRTLTLEPPFMVVATQNPLDFEGTYPLPENQLDRFLMRISLGYPAPADEARILDIRPGGRPLLDLSPVLTRAEVIALQARVDAVRVDPALLDYIVMLANATRRSASLLHGLSPRGALSLAQAARARAITVGRDYCTPEDITSNLLPVCAHRVVLRPTVANSQTADTVLRAILESTPRPG